MVKIYKTNQEIFWAEEFGNKYIDRNKSNISIASKCVLLSKIINRTRNVVSVIEYGANIGLNLRALKFILPQCEIAALEINSKAVKELKRWGGANEVFQDSIIEFQTKKTWDMVLVSGILIHINPDWLPKVYDLLAQTSDRYIVMAEYYNPTPVTINYRGNEDHLFKRDFAGEMMDLHPEFSLLDYGFTYHRDPNFPRDDVTWFLLEKS